MKNIELKKFGTVLTGRPFGVQTFTEINQTTHDSTVRLDFSGVLSLGSSFGEEVIVPLAKKQGNKITVVSTIPPVKDCIVLIATDFDLEIKFI